ncbi:MAG: class I SAM-dependent RNA methyltransferase, partial [Ignavibacteriales bacterium]|nr:class I SAM-dependent RNA methyltransferase [Ignavibacteriales bacterium]
MKRGDEITVEISSSAFEGKSVGRIDGYVIFVDGAVPGDVVTATVLKAKKNYAEARVLEILTPSSLRSTPRCPSFGTCGGCKWQHVSYEAQLRFKQQHVQEAFERIGGFEALEVLPIIGADEQYFYRNKMEFSFSGQQWLPEAPQLTIHNSQFANRLFLGLHVPQRYDKVLDIGGCYLQSDESTRILNFTRAFGRASGLSAYSGKSEE